MIRVSIFYPNTQESLFNLDYYLTQHIPMLEHQLRPAGLEKIEVDEGIGTPMPGQPVPFSVIEHLIFDNFENMQMALGEHSEALMADVPNFTNVLPLVQINKVAGDA
jgi:uncharacterized protein (TIGR02118 family)